MATEFHYQHPFPLGEDKTEYYLLTKDYVSVSEFEGQPILKIQKEAYNQAIQDAVDNVTLLEEGIDTEAQRYTIESNNNYYREVEIDVNKD